jgi:hypothetical protein
VALFFVSCEGNDAMLSPKVSEAKKFRNEKSALVYGGYLLLRWGWDIFVVKTNKAGETGEGYRVNALLPTK